MATRTVRINRQKGGGKNHGATNVDDGTTGKDSGTVVEVPLSDSEREYVPGAEDGKGSGAGEVGGEDSGELTPTGRKKRKYGKRSGSKRASEAETPENLTKILLHSHIMLARLLDVQELQLTNEEGTELAEAVQRVNELYDATWISDELSAWINLTIAGVSIYGPRWIAYNIRMKREAESGKRENPIDAPFVVSTPKTEVG